jgi:hypothetical protein
MLKISSGLKPERKKKNERIHSDKSFIEQFVELMFTGKEKEILYKIMSESWPLERERDFWNN